MVRVIVNTTFAQISIFFIGQQLNRLQNCVRFRFSTQVPGGSFFLYEIQWSVQWQLHVKHGRHVPSSPMKELV